MRYTRILEGLYGGACICVHRGCEQGHPKPETHLQWPQPRQLRIPSNAATMGGVAPPALGAVSSASFLGFRVLAPSIFWVWLRRCYSVKHFWGAKYGGLSRPKLKWHGG